MFLIKHTWGTPARGEVREFYRQLAHHCKSNFCDGAGPVFDLQTPAGQSVMILLGGKVEDMHRALDGIMGAARGRRNGACQPLSGPALRANVQARRADLSGDSRCIGGKHAVVLTLQPTHVQSHKHGGYGRESHQGRNIKVASSCNCLRSPIIPKVWYSTVLSNIFTRYQPPPEPDRLDHPADPHHNQQPERVCG